MSIRVLPHYKFQQQELYLFPTGMCTGDLPLPILNGLESVACMQISSAVSLPQYIFHIQCASVPNVAYCSGLRALINKANGHTEKICARAGVG